MNVASHAVGGLIASQEIIVRGFIDRILNGEYEAGTIVLPEDLDGFWLQVATELADTYSSAAYGEYGSPENGKEAANNYISMLSNDNESFKAIMDFDGLDDLPPIELKPDSMPEIPERVRPNPDLARKGMDFLLKHYLPFSQKWVPFAPMIYQVSAGIFLLSMITARRLVVKDMGDPEYTSLYFLFAGPSSAGKSAAAEKAVFVLKKLGLGHLILEGQVTPEYFKRESAGYIPDDWEDWEREEQSEYLFKLAWSGKKSMYIDEVGQLFKLWFNPTSTMGQWPRLLLSWENSRMSDEHGSITNGRFKIEDPYIAMLGCLTWSSVKKAPAVLDGFDNGFFARCFTCVAPPLPDDENEEDFDVKGDIEVPKELFSGLMNYHKSLDLPRADIVKKENAKDKEGKGSKRFKITREDYPETPIEMDVDARKFFISYRATLVKMSRNAKLVPEEIAPGYKRLSVKLLRVMAMFAHYDGCHTIRIEHVHAAISLAEMYWRPSMHAFYETCYAPPPSPKKLAEDRVHTYIERQSKAGRWVTLSDIASHNKLDKEYVAKMLKWLLEENQIQSAKKPAPTAKGAITVKYAKPGLETPGGYV